jgi:hypothetical protein
MIGLRSALVGPTLAAGAVAVGLAAMRTQEDFWYGALAAVVGVWALLMLAEGLAPERRGARRAPALFLAFLGLGLLIGFGPPSDATARRLAQAAPASRDARVPSVSTATNGLLWLLAWVDPAPRSDLTLDDPRRGFVAEVAIRGVGGGAWGPRTVADDLQVRQSARRAPADPTFRPDNLAVALDAAYLMASLALGWIGMGLGAIADRRRSRRAAASDSA